MTPTAQQLTFASTFSGIGGFELGFARAGIRPTVMVEVDKNATKVLEHRFPDIPKAGDIREVHGRDLGRPDLIAGGFPCQDTSIGAPNRLGLDGPRSGLYVEFVRLVDEHLRLVDDTRPRWTVIENVPGLLKSNGGRDMAAVVRGLESLGYGWAYRVVDSHHLGSPQRRPRVIVVGHRGGDPRPAWQVLGDHVPGGEADGPSPLGPRPRRPSAPVQPAGDDRLLIWRKSARARVSLAKGGYETWVPLADGDSSNTLTGFDGGLPTRQTHLVRQAGRLRTLTLTEWERLSGVPDGWTDMIPDGARYTALGNIAHPAMTEWLGRRIVAADAALPLLSSVR